MKAMNGWAAVLVGVFVASSVGCGGDGASESGGNGGTTNSTETGGGGGGGSTSSTSSGGGQSTNETGGTTTAPGACDGVITTFVPEWKPPEGKGQDLCTFLQVEDFFTACILPGANEADCNAFTQMSAENAACANCALSASEDEKYGPMTLYQDLNLLYENPGQCISEVEGDTTAESCGAQVFTTIQCAVAACSECKEVEFNTLLGCLDAAKAGSCKQYAEAEAACVAELKAAGVLIDICLPDGKDFTTYLKGLVNFMCGAP